MTTLQLSCFYRNCIHGYYSSFPSNDIQGFIIDEGDCNTLTMEK